MTKLDTKLIGFITVFENLTRARVKDAFIDKHNRVVFIVYEGDAGKAIGKMGSTIRRVSQLLKKQIKIIEYHEDVIEFAKNAIDPIRVDSYDLQDATLTIHSKDTSVRARLIGRDKANLKDLQELIDKYFHVTVRVA